MQIYEIELIQSGFEKRIGNRFVNINQGICLKYFHGTEQIAERSYFDENGMTHRPAEEGPAEIYFNQSGSLSTEVYRIHGKYTGRPSDNASIVHYHDNGQVSELMWKFGDYIVWDHENQRYDSVTFDTIGQILIDQRSSALLRSIMDKAAADKNSKTAGG